ncbi:MAG: hypothetical protein NT023_25780 [Armatimonadetes bacterium]|nr:hypothetical protein [Armatimonadota bacterium]
MSAGTPYQNLISAQSRRLRVIGIVLLVMILGMCVYGGRVLMPKLRENRAPLHNSTVQATSSSTALSPVKAESLRKLAKAQLLFFYAYWGVCFALIIALLVVAYLDFREVSRNYLRLQVSLLSNTAPPKTLQEED